MSHFDIQPRTYHFGKYTLRPATPDDMQMATEWVSADPWHAPTMAPEFFVAQLPGLESYVLEDARGPVFFFHMTRAVRLDIQFPPEDDIDEARERVREGLREGFQWLETLLSINGVHQVIFESSNPMLIRSAEKRLGFRASPNELVRDILARKEALNVRRLQPQQESANSSP